MADNPRIEELRRRVQKDKASIAFAQLAEEYRRAGRFQEAIETCTTGLSHHPGYLSAHVTLGRALIETGDLQAAQDELRGVLVAAPENLAAIKGLAEIHHRRGELKEALEHYRKALEYAPHDPDLEHLIGQLTRELEPAPAGRDVPDGLSFEEAIGEFLAFTDKQPAPAPPVAAPAPGLPEGVPEPAVLDVVVPSPGDMAAASVDLPLVTAPDLVLHESDVVLPEPDLVLAAPDPDPSTPGPVLPAWGAAPAAPENLAPAMSAESDPPPQPPAAPAAPSAVPPDLPDETAATKRASMQVEALERWLDAILAGRDQQG